MSKVERLALDDNCAKGMDLKLRPGMGWLIYTDHGPTGITGQSMSITCPHSVFAIFPDEEALMERVKSGKFLREGKKSNMQYGVIGDWSNGGGSVVVFKKESK